MLMCSFILLRFDFPNVAKFVQWMVADLMIQLGNSLAQNCGPKIHRELASRSFTDTLLRLANDRVCLLGELKIIGGITWC